MIDPPLYGDIDQNRVPLDRGEVCPHRVVDVGCHINGLLPRYRVVDGITYRVPDNVRFHGLRGRPAAISRTDEERHRHDEQDAEKRLD